jgi:hypothetical protein
MSVTQALVLAALTAILDFHSTLAISASYVDFLETKPTMSLRSLYHISQAYSLVNQKLSGPEPVADDAIASVVSLVIYQQIHSQDSVGITHLNGLEESAD